MKNMNKLTKITLIFAAITAFVLGLAFVLYLIVLPFLVSNDNIIKYIEKTANKSAGINLTIKNPLLKTSLTPDIAFSVDEINIDKNEKNLLNLKNFSTDISFLKFFKKNIIIKKLGADYIFADVNSLMELSAPNEGKETKCDWLVDIFESLLYVKKCIITYRVDKNTLINVDLSDVEITKNRNPKYVHFKAALDIIKNNDKLSFKTTDNDSVYIDKKKLIIKDCALNINKSKILISSTSDQKNNYDVHISSRGFDVNDVVELLGTNFIIPNGEEILSYFKNIGGSFDFDIKASNNSMSGLINFKKGYLTIVPLANLKVTLDGGRVDITPNEILLNNFSGNYNNKESNPIKLEGSIKDYMKSFETEVVIDTVATKEFSKKHLSKLAGCPLEIVGKAPTRIVYKQIYDKIDLAVMAKLNKGDDILVDGISLTPVNYDRAVKADMHLEKNILNIDSINYYIAQTINKDSKIKPILKIYGNVECTKGQIQNLGFEIPKPLPSEFLNLFAGQKVFRKGTISGYLQVVNTGKYPVLDGNLTAQNVRVPSQRLSIKDAKFATSNGNINLLANGRYKRSQYKLTGAIANEMKFPIIVKDIDLSIDDIDINRILNSFNNQNTAPIQEEKVTKEAMLVSADKSASEEDNDAVTFNTGILIVEKCTLNVIKGAYNDLTFGNLKADLTLDKNGILNVKSNRFDIAEGISSCKVNCDLKNHKYSLVLGVKDINSDTMATSLLALKKEISGKASGIISLHTDDTLMLNGFMKFIVKDGTIGKIGLVEYVLKFAALFRNPMAMISPSTFVDLVNVPEGNFDKITGDLTIKDNVIEKIIIKSQSAQLSSLIVGRFDLASRDATLRIYTKFSNKNKGFSGALRNLSLNSLANRVPLSSRNDSNYYSAELEHLPAIEADERDCQVFLTKVDGDVERNNFISSLKKIK